MDKVERKVFQGLFVLSLLLVILLVGVHEKIYKRLGETAEPFVKDRVVTIRIVMDENSWQRIMSDPGATEYERADF